MKIGFGAGFGRKKREDNYGWGSIFKNSNKKSSTKGTKNDRFSGKEKLGPNRSGSKEGRGKGGTSKNVEGGKGIKRDKISKKFGNDRKGSGKFNLQQVRSGNDRQDDQFGRGRGQQNNRFINRGQQGSIRGGTKDEYGRGGSKRPSHGNQDKRGHDKSGGWSGRKDMYDNRSGDNNNGKSNARNSFGNKRPNYPPPALQATRYDYDYMNYTDYGNYDYINDTFDIDYGTNDYGNEDWQNGNEYDSGYDDDMSFPDDDFDDTWGTSKRPPFHNNFNDIHVNHNDFKRKGNRNGQFKGRSKNKKGRFGQNKRKWNNKNTNEFERGIFGGMMFFKDMLNCDEMVTCGRGGIMQEMKSCICESLWSKNADPTGKLCQAIPKTTREQAVRVISMFMKENGPVMPRNRTIIRKIKRMAAMWGHKFEKLVSVPFEKDDTEVSI